MVPILKPFGRHFLLSRIDQGGMADIYLSRLATADSHGHLVIIKLIRPPYGTDKEFLKMFKSEIKLTTSLNHRTIIKIYDFGEEEGNPYIVMEFVEGKNLKHLMVKSSQLKQKLPIQVVCHIILQVAIGLDYAHSFQDKMTAQALPIVHRDVSPQNILLSYGGAIKIIDFGIAKAATASDPTHQNILKGKPSYLSPEQVVGLPVDCRSDLFSLGTVFWELLTGKKLFSGDNYLAILKAIADRDIVIRPPSSENPNIPPEIDEIVLKALKWDLTERFQTSEDFHKSIHRYLISAFPAFNSADIGSFMSELFENEIEEEQTQIRQLNLQANQHLKPVKSSHSRKKSSIQTPLVQKASGARVFDYTSDIDKTVEVNMNAPNGSSAIGYGRGRSALETSDSKNNGAVRLAGKIEILADATEGKQLPEVGFLAPTFKAISFDGKMVDLSGFRGKKVWLMFYRYATCPLCNYHLSKVGAAYSLLRSNGLEVIAVFDSPVPMFYNPGGFAQPPFPIVADPKKDLYRLFQTRNSILGVLKLSVGIGLIRAIYNGFKQGKPAGEFNQLPSHFLINENGVIVTTYHGKSAVDHLSWHSVGIFAKISAIQLKKYTTDGLLEKTGSKHG